MDRKIANKSIEDLCPLSDEKAIAESQVASLFIVLEHLLVYK